MSHYVLSVELSADTKAAAKKNIWKGSRATHQSQKEAHDAAAAISSMADVLRVAVTYVTEIHDSMWRKGKKS